MRRKLLEAWGMSGNLKNAAAIRCRHTYAIDAPMSLRRDEEGKW
jgi:hypothetical protein